MSKPLTIFFIAILILTSCHQNQKYSIDDGKNIQITIDPKKTELIRLSEIASNIEYVKLETRSDIYIPYSYNLVITENQIYIVGASHSGSYLCCFDRNGKFIFKYARRGKGPGEYLDITDICINPKNQQIELLDEHTKKIIRIGPNGEFISELKLPLSASIFAINQDGTYLVRTKPDYRLGQEKDTIAYQLHKLSSDGKQILHSSFPINYVNDFNNDAFLSESSDKQLFTLGFRDTIFTLNSSGEIMGSIAFDFMDDSDQFYRRLESSIRQNSANEFLNTYVGKAHISKVISLPKFLFVYYYQRDKIDHLSHFRVFQSLNTQHFKQTQDPLVNDIDGVRLGQPATGTKYNELVFIINYEGLIEESKTNTSPEFLKVFERIKPDTESDNAVLAIVTLKEF